MALDLIAELEAVIAALDRNQIEYALCGGLALGLHGHPRATMDIDLLVRPERLAAALDVVRGNGFDVPAHREIHRISKLDLATNDLMSLDLVVVNSELEGVWSDRGTFDVGGQRMVVVSRAGLAIMKRIAGRPQDLVDVAKLEGTDDADA